MRRLICVFLLLLLPLHAFAMQGGWLPGAGAFDLAHEIAHAQGVSHHHHGDDGSIHYDDSDESKQHAAEDSCSQQSASLPSAVLTPPNLPASSLAAMPPAFDIRDGLLERPQRPPSALG